MSDAGPIGVFDSGVGGLTVWQEIAARLPHESTIYVADQAHCPYGPRPAGEIAAFSTEISRFLVENRCKLIVVACNTASAAALYSLRQKFNAPFVGLEPAVKPAAQATKTGHIGVLATAGTFRGALFQHTAQTCARRATIHRQIAPGLVPLVEAGQFDGPQTGQRLRQYLEPMLAAQVDQLVLGCTHYPFLIPAIEKITGHQMTILNPAEAVARRVQRLLQNRQLAAPPHARPARRFYSAGDAAAMRVLLSKMKVAAEVERLFWRAGRLVRQKDGPIP